MSSYSGSAELYDVLYSELKDYRAEAARLAEILWTACPSARSVLDVACGTGRHAELLAASGLSVDGLDLEPAFVRIAQARHPSGTFRVGDMTSFGVAGPYDAVVCLFGSIGYALDEAGLHAAVRCFASAVRAGGVVVVEPWLTPEDAKDGHVSVHSACAEGLVVSRVSRLTVRGFVSHLEFEYLVGDSGGVRHISERHALGLFTEADMIHAFEAAGLRARRESPGLTERALYIATRP